MTSIARKTALAFLGLTALFLSYLGVIWAVFQLSIWHVSKSPQAILPQ